MRTKIKSMADQVREMVMAGIDAGLVMDPAWITTEVIGKHPEISGEDKDWYVECATAYVRKAVSDVVREFRGVPSRDEQITLPGFEFIQKAYAINRDGRPQLVPTDQITQAECVEKIQELEAMAAGCISHARELKRYMDSRF